MGADFTIGCRGGDWYAFANNRRATEHLKARGGLTFKTPYDAIRHVSDNGFSYRMEGETHVTVPDADTARG